MKIGDLIWGMLADDTGFKADLVAKAQKAGDEAGVTMGQRLGNGLKAGVKAGLVGVGAAAAVAFGLGAKGLIELDSAMGEFRAETGATEEDVKSASAAVLDFSKRNLAPIKEISATMAALRTEMGLDQKAAEALTEPFLKFAEVTGQTAPDAVKGFDDILDAWNLTAEDSQGIMDQLIESHQQYGGSIAENQAALTAMAPALQAANMSFDDGIGLLNLFADAGVDSAAVAVAFQKALSKVKSPEELQRLIDDIIATEDPFERAQKAADLFGVKAGAKLAQALAPGSESLDDYAITAEEAAGSTTEAAKAFEDTWGNRAKLWIKNITGMATELLQNLGPGIGGVALAVPLLGSVLKPLFNLMKTGGTKIIPALGGAIKTMALNIPTALGYMDLMIAKMKALGLAGSLAVGGIIAVGLAVGTMNAQIIDSQIGLAKRIRELGGDITTIFQQAQKLADETGMSWNEAAEQIVSGMETAAEKSRNAEQMMSQGWAEAWSKVNVVTAEGGRLVAATADGIPIEVADALEAGAGSVETGAKTAWSPIHDEIVKARNKAEAEARATPGAIAQALLDGRDLVLAAATGLSNAATDPLLQQAQITEIREQMHDLANVTAEEIEAATPATVAADKLKYAQLEIQLAGYLLRADPKSKEAANLLAKYAKSADPATRAAYEAMMSAVEDRAFIMANDLEAEAERAGIAPEEALRRHKVAAATEAALLAAGVRNRMRQEMDGVGADGEEDGAEWAAGVAAGILKNYYLVENAGAAVRNVLDQAGAAVAPGKPPAPAKPAPAKPAPGPVYKQPLPQFAQGSWDVPRDMVAGLHRGELVVPRAIADTVRQSAETGNPDVVNNTWILNVEGVPRTVDSKRAALDELERLGETWG